MYYRLFPNGIIILSLLSALALVYSIILLTLSKVIYATSPKFWDRVYYEKETHFKGGVADSTDSNESVSSINILLLRMLPNVRVLANLGDREYNPKEYVMEVLLAFCLLATISYVFYSGLLMRFIAWLK